METGCNSTESVQYKEANNLFHPIAVKLNDPLHIYGRWYRSQEILPDSTLKQLAEQALLVFQLKQAIN